MLHDLIIVGAGPAGLSTAIHLQHIVPELAKRTLIIEKARHPRPKLCAGGLLLRLALMNMSSPVYQTFVMERVDASARATVASLVSMSKRQYNLQNPWIDIHSGVFSRTRRKKPGVCNSRSSKYVK